MANNNQSAIQGSYANSTISLNPADRANNFSNKFGLTTSGDIPSDCGGKIDYIYAQGSDHHFQSVRPTIAQEYTTGQLEYAKTCLKKAIEVEGYDIDNEFEEKHNITVEEVSFGETPDFDAVKHSDAVFGEDRQDCGQGLRFRLNLEGLGKGVFEALWNLPAGADQFDYFYGLGAMELICQHIDENIEIPTLSQLADHGCIAGYLTDFDYWYKIDKDIEVGDETYRANTYIKVMPNGEFEGNFVFADQEDVPIKECEEFYEVKDIVELDINGIWVKERPDEGEIEAENPSTGGVDSPTEDPSTGQKCRIEHDKGDPNCYTVIGISDEEPLTHSYDYGDVVAVPSFQESRFKMQALYFPEDHLQFVPVWDEVGFIEGVVPMVQGTGSAGGNPAGWVCPSSPNSSTSEDSAVLYHSNKPEIIPEKIWDIMYWNVPVCGSFRDVSAGSPKADSDHCGYFTAEVLNPLSGLDGPGAVPEYFKTSKATIVEHYYEPIVEAPEDVIYPYYLASDTAEENPYAEMPAVIDCFLGDSAKSDDGEILINGESTCLHCDCHYVHHTSVHFDVGCDPCLKCGDGDKNHKMEDPSDYYHIQSLCPRMGSPYESRDEQLEDDYQVFIKDSCVGVSCDFRYKHLPNVEFVLQEGTKYSNWKVDYAHRTSEAATFDFGYKQVDPNSVEYAEKHTFRCIVTHNVCGGAYDFMKETPEFSGASKLTAIYRKIVDADEFNKCGEDRLPDLNYTDLDLLEVEGSVYGAVGDLDFFPQSAIAEKVELTAIDGGIDAYNLTDEQKETISELLAQWIDPNAVMRKTIVDSQTEFCGMGSKFREERRKKDQDFKVSCRCDNYVPSLYADPARAAGSLGTICRDEWDKIQDDWNKALDAADLTEADGDKIIMSYLYGPGTVCKEIMRQAVRIPAILGERIEDGSDNWGFYGQRFVNCKTEDIEDPPVLAGSPAEDPKDKDCCIQKWEPKPVPRVSDNREVDKRKCNQDIFTDYANLLIGNTQEDADLYNPTKVLFENLIKPISPSTLEVSLDQNKPPYRIEVKKCLYSLKGYSFEIGDN